MSKPKMKNIYPYLLSSDIDKKLWANIPDGEVVYVSPLESCSWNSRHIELVIERFKKDPLIGLIYSDIEVHVGENYYTMFLNDDNKIDDGVPVFVVKRSNIDVSQCSTISEVFNLYISNNQRVEHIAETVSSY